MTDLKYLQEIFNTFISLATKAEKNIKGSKTAAKKARLKSMEIREELKDWRQESLE
ncbi:MAG: histone H1 [Chlamydiia bacterium]|nr:histone H1 [Chlamydiia bacterium]